MALVGFLLSLPGIPATATADSVQHASFAGLQWRLIGPFRGGRSIAVTGVNSEPDHFYFGGVDGGVWESRNAGRTWEPIFDGEGVGSIGAIAVAPSASRTIYVGSGEADMRSDIAYGNGLYKSADGGKTWVHLGLDDTRQIAGIVVDPHDANVVYVAAGGHQYGPNAQRGVFKTIDGGQTWTRVLYKDENTGAFSLAMDPSNQNVLYAALWQTRRPPWNVYAPSNGPGSGIYKTSDGGKTWTQLHAGLPDRIGRVGLAVSPSAPNRVYAMVDSAPAFGGLYRSDDAGRTWSLADGERRIWKRGWYFSGVTVDPHDANTLYVMNTSTYRSTDGGRSFKAILGDPSGDDFHSAWIDPTNSNHIILGSDQGAVVSVDGGETWSSWYNQPTGQFYHVTTDDAFPYRVYGAQQDSGSDMQPSATKYLTISQQDFHPIDAGGESGSLAVDPRSPHLVYGGRVTREDPQTGWEQDVDPTLDHLDKLWRSTWTLPLTFSAADKVSLYTAHQNVWRTRNGGKTWTIVSPDLTRERTRVPSNLDPTTAADDNGFSRHGVVYAIAPSPLRRSELWAGTDDGLVWVTRNDGRQWKNVTPHELTAWSKVGTIEASHFDPATAYIAIDRHRLEDYAAYIYRTHDFGRSWTRMDTGIPVGSFVNVVREDPRRPGLLYAGTEKGIYFSIDDGAGWQSLQLNLPTTSVRDIAVHGDDLIVATHGRAFWILDDIEPLRELSAAIVSRDYLFTPATAYRVRPGSEDGTPLPSDEPQASNRLLGVYIDYYLAGPATTPVTIDILNTAGSSVRHFSSTDSSAGIDLNSIDFTASWLPAPALPRPSPGFHRFVWDFHEDRSDGPLAPPGSYVVRLSVNNHSYIRPATVRKDPRVGATDADLREQYELARRIEELRKKVDTLREEAGRLGNNAVAGRAPPDNPDGSVGAKIGDIGSLRYVDASLARLELAVESADAHPTPIMYDAFRQLNSMYMHDSAQLHASGKT